MATQHSVCFRTTVQSTNRAFRDHINELKTTDKDIYPVEVLNDCVTTLYNATRMEHLKSCLETPGFKQLVDLVLESLNLQHDRSFLESKGFTEDDFDTIDTNTKLFNEILKQPMFSGRAQYRTQEVDFLGENGSGPSSDEEETGKIDRGGQPPGGAGGMRLSTKRSQDQRTSGRKRFKP